MTRPWKNVRINERELRLYVLDSSDAADNANIYFAEFLEWTAWIKRVQERHFPEPEGRQVRLETAQLGVAAILLRNGIADDVAELVSGELVGVFNRLMPAAPAEPCPEMPGETTFERLSRAKEYRRKAFGKLLRELAAQPLEKQHLDEILNDCRNEQVVYQVLDAVMDATNAETEPEAPLAANMSGIALE